jgi:hypothetical protein
MQYKQLPLTGSTNDYANTEDELVGVYDLLTALDVFFEENREYNPRQLFYYIQSEAYSKHLDVLLGLKD